MVATDISTGKFKKVLSANQVTKPTIPDIVYEEIAAQIVDRSLNYHDREGIAEYFGDMDYQVTWKSDVMFETSVLHDNGYTREWVEPRRIDVFVVNYHIYDDGQPIHMIFDIKKLQQSVNNL